MSVMALPVHLEVANSPGGIGWPEVSAVGVGTRQPAKLYFSALPQVRGMRTELDVGDQLRAASRCVPPKDQSVDVLAVLADFRPPPGLPPPVGLVLATGGEKVITAGRAKSPSPPSSDTATPESASDLEDALSQGSEIGDEWEETAEHCHEARQHPERMQLGPPGFFCIANQGPRMPPPGIFF